MSCTNELLLTLFRFQRSHRFRCVRLQGHQETLSYTEPMPPIQILHQERLAHYLFTPLKGDHLGLAVLPHYLRRVPNLSRHTSNYHLWMMTLPWISSVIPPCQPTKHPTFHAVQDSLSFPQELWKLPLRVSPARLSFLLLPSSLL